jgi:hypothetical protein
MTQDCYASEDMTAASVYSRDGQRLDRFPASFSETPHYVVWDRTTKIELGLQADVIASVRFANVPGTEFVRVKESRWTGFAVSRRDATEINWKTLMPEQLAEAPSRKEVVLRDRRNRVWSRPAPWDETQPIVIKQFKPARGLRRLRQAFKPSKALRSWNGAQELIRRGLGTPKPLAFFQDVQSPSRAEGYYVCEAFADSFSARQAFTAFSRGETHFRGFPAPELYRNISEFLVKMHDRGVFFRDLSAGNLLLQSGAGGRTELALIDTGRARFYSHGVSVRQRLADLMRICHPLSWKERGTFLTRYQQQRGQRLERWMKIPFIYYDWKHRLKKALKAPFRNRR